MARKQKEPLYENAYKRTVRDTEEERDRCWGKVKSYAGTQSSMVIEWDLNEDAKADQVCKITIGRESVYVSVEQMQKFLRWV